MTIQTDIDYQAGMSRMELLLKTHPENLLEIEVLGAALETCEDSHGHAPVPVDSLIFRMERFMFENQLKKQDLAALLGITNSRLSEVLNGKRVVNMDLGWSLYIKLNIPADFILIHA